MARMSGLSKKELEMVSFLELNKKFFFTRDYVRRFFKNDNELSVYIHRLIRKNRIVKLNKSKYYLIPVKAYKGNWSEHPFIIIDEIFNSKNYFIDGYAAAHYWGLIEQIPTQIEVFTSNKQGTRKVFDFTIIFKRIRKNKMEGFISQKIKDHTFIIASKKKVEKWLKSK